MESTIVEKLKEKGLSPSSINLYLKALKGLNDKKEIKNFKFLTKPEAILDKLKDYKPTTQRNTIIAIVSILKALDNALYSKYYDIMINMTKQINENNKTNEKTETQKKNWIDWDSVLAKFNEMKANLKLSRSLTDEQYSNLLDFVVLALYVLIPPRRNKDYIDMVITAKAPKETDKNYLDIKKQQFIFNVYKTAKKDGQLIVGIPDELMSIIKIYIRHHPLKNQLPAENIPFLVFKDGSPVKDNGITRILNKVFGKKIGSSMLRHIYLSSKYGKVLEDQKKDSELMSHNLNTARDYIKTDKK